MDPKTRLVLQCERTDTLHRGNWLSATGSLKGWEVRVRRIPILSSEQEMELGLKNDPKAREKLVVHNLRILIWEAMHFPCPSGVEFDDIIAEGCLGLIHAAELYDGSAPFHNYALYHIDSRIRRFLDMQTTGGLDGVVRIPSGTVDLLYRMRRDREDAYKNHGDDTAVDRPVKFRSRPMRGRSPEDAAYDMSRLEAVPSHLVEDELVDERTSTEQSVLNDMLALDIDRQLATIPRNEEDVVRRRCGLPPYPRPMTLEEVAKEFGLTRERIRQIEAKALRRLRQPKRSRYLVDYTR